MSDREGKDSERYYVAYQRHMVVGLVFVACLVPYNVWEVLRTTPGRATGGLLMGAVFLVVLLVVHLVTLRGHLWTPRGHGERTVLNDEWTRTNRRRAAQTALWVTLAVQWPMTFFMALVPPITVKGVIGMGNMTFLLGLGTYLGGYLYYSRQPSDG